MDGKLRTLLNFRQFYMSNTVKNLEHFQQQHSWRKKILVDNFLFWWESFGISKIIFQWLLHASKITSRRKLILLTCKRNLSQAKRWPQTLLLWNTYYYVKIRVANYDYAVGNTAAWEGEKPTPCCETHAYLCPSAGDLSNPEKQAEILSTQCCQLIFEIWEVAGEGA